MTVDEMRSAVVAEALSWLHTPYHHNARLKGVGTDCVWLLIEVYQQAAGFAMDVAPGNYSRGWYLHHAEEIYLGGIKKYCRQIEAHDVGPGDIAAYKVGRCVSHGAIIIDGEYLIHANRKAGEVEISLRRAPELDEHLHSYWTPFT